MQWLLVGLFAGGLLQAANCSQPFRVDLPTGASLKLDLRPTEVDVVGTDGPALRVTCDVYGTRTDATSVEIGWEAASRELRVFGRTRGRVHVRVEVPRQTNLTIRAARGTLRVEAVSGNKDIEQGQGDLMLIGLPAREYSHADASVGWGTLNAFAFGFNRTGHHPAFTKDSPEGSYRLHAHLGAGQIVLSE